MIVDMAKVKRQNQRWIRFQKNRQLLILTLPAILYLLIFHYVPIGGLVLAFKNYRYDLGIWGSEWVGLQNFKFVFSSAVGRILRNTVIYNLTFLVLATIINTTIALLMNELRNKTAIKIYQTSMFFPYFLSWVVVAFIVYAFLSPGYGWVNQILKAVGLEPKQWYSDASVWPGILIFTYNWKGMGYGIILNYAVLVGIDSEYYDAARVDGAGRWKMALHISIPHLIPVTLIQFILGIGGIFGGDFGLFYQVPRNSALLRPTTEVMNTYIFRSLMDSNEIGRSTAAGFLLGILSVIVVLATNKIVKSIDEDYSLF